MKSRRRLPQLRWTATLLVAAALLAGCDILPIQPPPATQPIQEGTVPAAPPTETPEPPPPIEVAEITFRVTIPTGTPSDGPIQLSLLDEVTGLALNARHHTMQAESENIYSVSIQLPANAIIKYRYTRGGDVLAAEHTSDGRPVRYRLIQTTASGSVHDIVTQWNDTRYDGPMGRINGSLTDAETGAPLANIMVTAGGQTVYTHWDGTFLIEGLPPGTHNLVAYAMDGMYSTFQQGAVVAAQASTPADFELSPSRLSTVSFILTVPEGSIPAAPVRIAGNLLQLGNVFADLSGGTNTPASRLPLLSYDPEGFYLYTAELPAGTYVRYKYTLGDGFWNMETDGDGGIVLREFIVPETDTVINDAVAGWGSRPGFGDILFTVTTPENTPDGESLWIQFNPWGWTEPIPMWRTGANEWVYLLRSPLHFLGEVEYRFCRNGQCDRARDNGEARRAFQAADTFQSIDTEITGWISTAAAGAPPAAPGAEAAQKSAPFTAGLAFPVDIPVSWAALAPSMLPPLAELGANTILLHPTWTAARLDPPVLQPVPGVDLAWPDAAAITAAASAAGLDTALHPLPRFPSGAGPWWIEASREYGWWVNWFEKYESFLRHHAGLAEITGAGTLVIGSESIRPSYPEGTLPDGFTSGVPKDAETWWRSIIENVRGIYSGRLAFALTSTGDLEEPPAFIDAFDVIYIPWQFPLADSSDADLETMSSNAAELFENRLLPFYLRYNKALVIVLQFPSTDGAARICIETGNGGCAPPGPIDFEEQALAYEAVLRAVNGLDWVEGVVSAGFYPPVELLDQSISIHGKPAEDLLSRWFRGWLAGP